MTGTGPATKHELPGASDDEAIVARSRHDPRAFGALYDRYVGPVYRYCYLRLGNREAAEDAASAVFVKALAGLTTYRPGNFPGWLFRIAANVVADARRQAVRRVSVPFETLPEPPDPDLSPDALLLMRDEARRLRAALATLPDDQRATVELQLAGWSSEQIAAVLERSPDAVRMLRHRAITRLREILTAEEQPGGRR